VDILNLGRDGPTGNPVKFHRVHGELSGFDDHSEVVYLRNGEFLKLEMQVKFGHVLENTFGLFFMEFIIWEEDEDIVHLDNEPSFGDHVSKGVIHETLEGRQGVSESKEHHRGFEEAFVGDEGGFPLLSVLVADIVVSPSHNEFGEGFGISEFIKEVRDERKGVGVSDSVFIYLAVVLAGSESTVFLFDTKEGGSLGEVRWADLSSC
jgi:hypothetical protein